MGLRADLPQHCPDCGHDPTGDDEEFRSGGGWAHDHSVVGGVWTETFRCPRCRNVVAKDEKRPGEVRP